MPVLNTALPVLLQMEVKLTVCELVPPPVTVAVTLVVPKADSGLAPTTMEEIETATAPTVKPDDPVTVVLPAWALAVMVVAPAFAPPVRVMDATPDPLVNAVPEVGVMFAMVASVVKVTTALGTAAPLASLTVAVTVVEVPLEIELLASATVKLGAPVGVPPVPPVPPVPLLPLSVLAPLQPARIASAVANRNGTENLVIL